MTRNLDAHKDVLRKWQARPPHDTETFVSDGPIDPNRWLEIERRVLFLAKEAHWEGRRDKTWDLPKLIREEWKGPRKKLWRTLPGILGLRDPTIDQWTNTVKPEGGGSTPARGH